MARYLKVRLTEAQVRYVRAMAEADYGVVESRASQRTLRSIYFACDRTLLDAYRDPSTVETTIPEDDGGD